jgi:hypothetical protein
VIVLGLNLLLDGFVLQSQGLVFHQLLLEALDHLNVFLFVNVVELFEGVKVLGWGGVEHFDVLIFLVPVLDHIVHEKVVDLSLGKSKIASISDEYVVRLL